MKFLSGLLAGALIGAGVALLFAPEKGDDLRARLRTEAENEYHRMQEKMQNGMTQLQDQMDKLSSDVQSMTNRSKETTPQVE